MERKSDTQAVTKREQFAGTEVTTTAGVDIASAAMAAQAKAIVEAAYVMAMRNPRDPDDVRVRLLKDCSRASFARSARYNKPVGNGGVQGWSIRFAEAAIRAMTNIAPRISLLYEDRDRRVLSVSVTDLEANVPYSQDVIIEKTVERRNPRQGAVVLSSRTNSAGEKVYLVEATEDEMLQKANALISKALRTLGLRLVPADLLDEALTKVKDTLAKDVDDDPDAERKRLADAFAEMGVNPSKLKEYLGQELSGLTPAQLRDLRGVYQGLRDGDVSWSDIMDKKRAESQPPAGAEEPGAEGDKQPPKTRKEALKGHLSGKGAPRAAQPPADPAADVKKTFDEIAKLTDEGFNAGRLTEDECNEIIGSADEAREAGQIGRLQAIRDELRGKAAKK